MEEEKNCKTCTRLQENGFCGLQTAGEVADCLNNSLTHWTSIYNPQYEIDIDSLDDM